MTTTVRPTPSASSVSRTCPRSGRPAIGFSTFARSLCMRLPMPAASTTAATFEWLFGGLFAALIAPSCKGSLGGSSRPPQEIGAHPLDDERMLRILLAEHEDLGLHGIQEPRDDRRDAVEVPGP